MLSTSSINEIMCETECYIGTFSMDICNCTNELSRLLNKHICFIVNTQSIIYPGKHWIAVFMNSNRAEIYDPIGHPPPTRLYNCISSLVPVIEWNDRGIQSIFSNNCGSLCIQFLKHRHSYPTVDFKSFLNYFFI